MAMAARSGRAALPRKAERRRGTCGEGRGAATATSGRAADHRPLRPANVAVLTATTVPPIRTTTGPTTRTPRRRGTSPRRRKLLSPRKPSPSPPLPLLLPLLRTIRRRRRTRPTTTTVRTRTNSSRWTTIPPADRLVSTLSSRAGSGRRRPSGRIRFPPRRPSGCGVTSKVMEEEARSQPDSIRRDPSAPILDEMTRGSAAARAGAAAAKGRGGVSSPSTRRYCSTHRRT
mmetsp:Transcript_42793/g.130137  ORF Transcript_42793/g.130137 Transcript_42793/m.130137 type:complete len:230 (+) Transcript_42793:216-905(+)